MLRDDKKNRIYKKVTNILLDTSNTDIDRYNKIRKVKNLDDEYYSKDKVLEIMYKWLMDNAEYNEERDRYNGHNWRLEYIERYDKLVNKVNKIKSNPKKSNSTKSSPKKSSPSKSSPSKLSPSKSSPSKSSPSKSSPKKSSPSKSSPKKSSGINFV